MHDLAEFSGSRENLTIAAESTWSGSVRAGARERTGRSDGRAAGSASSDGSRSSSKATFATCFVRPVFPTVRKSASCLPEQLPALPRQRWASRCATRPSRARACAGDLALAAGIRSNSLRAISSKAALEDVAAPGQDLAVCVDSALPADPCARLWARRASNAPVLLCVHSLTLRCRPRAVRR